MAISGRLAYSKGSYGKRSHRTRLLIDSVISCSKIPAGLLGVGVDHVPWLESLSQPPFPDLQMYVPVHHRLRKEHPKLSVCAYPGDVRVGCVARPGLTSNRSIVRYRTGLAKLPPVVCVVRAVATSFDTAFPAPRGILHHGFACRWQWIVPSSAWGRIARAE